MKRVNIIFIIMFLIAAVGIASAGTDSEGRSSKASKIISDFKFDPIKWNVPEIDKEVKRVVLKNGMTLFLMEDRELPLINVRAIIRTGNIYVPPEQDGIAGITGIVMRTGSTRNITPEELNDQLEYMAASIETGIGYESGYATLSVLSKDIDEGLKLFADVLMNPAFQDSQLAIEKNKIKEMIRRRNDTPQSTLAREYNHILYGDHPYGRILEWETVKDISSEDLKAFHKKYYKPNNTMIAVSGDFKTKDMIKKFDNAFKKWKKGNVVLPSVPDVAYDFKSGVYLMEKDQNQSRIEIGKLGIKRTNPDKYAITILNYILGGGAFSSRLTSRVRSDEGLAYHVSSSFSTSDRDYGLFTASVQTKTSSTHKAISLILEEIERIRNEKVSDEELELAKDAFINGYIFNFVNTSQVVNRLMGLEYNSYPRDYFKNYINNINTVTVDDINGAAKKYLDTKSMTIAVIGKAEDFDGAMSDFGDIHSIEITEPILE